MKFLKLLPVFLLCLSVVAKDNVDFDVSYQPDQVLFQALDAHASFDLTIRGPQGIRQMSFDGSQSPIISLYDELGEALPDGLYAYELRSNPIVNPETRENFAERQARAAELGRATSGFFRVLDGMIVNPGEREGSVAKDETGLGGNGGDETLVDDADTGRDIIHADDVIIDGSACVGFDCVNGEVFGFDTLRLKENNLRINFMDTSVGSFPTTDWRIIANDSASGGGGYLAIEDATASRIPFRVEANAPSHSLYVDDGGRVGFGTSIPVVDLHVVSGNTPTLRLEQNGTSGFQPQTWDLAGNETSFFLRDASNGSTLPFRVFPGNPNNLLNLRNDNVGVNTLSPTEKLHVADGNVLITEGNFTMTTANGHMGLIENIDENAGSRVLLELKNKGTTQMLFRNTAGARWGMGASGSGFFFSDNTAGSAAFNIDNSGEVVITNNAGTDILRLTSAGDLFLLGSVQPGAPKAAQQDIDNLRNQVKQQQERLDAQAAELDELRTRMQQLLDRLEER